MKAQYIRMFTGALLLAACCAGCGKGKPKADPVADLLAQRGKADFSIQDSARIRTEASGLKIYMVQEGPGPRPAEESRVRMHYHGEVLHGAAFDDTWSRNKPFDFVLGKTALIAGMEEAVRKLRIGSKAVLIIPPALGYTGEDLPPNIPPNATLVYQVEILGNI